MNLIIKSLIVAVLVAVITTVSKKSALIGAFFASLPITSIFAFIWLYHDGQDRKALIDLSNAIFWLVIPSLMLFLTFPWFLKRNYDFYPSLLGAATLTSISYTFLVLLLKQLKILG